MLNSFFFFLPEPEHRYLLILLQLYYSFVLVKNLLSIHPLPSFAGNVKMDSLYLQQIHSQACDMGVEAENKHFILHINNNLVIKLILFDPFLLQDLTYCLWLKERKTCLYSINFLFFLMSQNIRDGKSLDMYVLDEINTQF